MRALTLVTLAVLRLAALLLAILPLSTTALAEPLAWRGVDLSSLPAVESSSSLGELDVVTFAVDQGANLLRLRLWHTPAIDHANLASSLKLARRGHAAGLSILLDFHYSDTWADPGSQQLPAAWRDLDFETLLDSLRVNTRDTMLHFRRAGIPIAAVQLGNEINAGILWPHGRLGGSSAAEVQWSQLAQLLNAARHGVIEATRGATPPEIFLHFDNGTQAEIATWFFDQLIAYGANFDAIALSYYPWWHGSLDQLEASIRELGDHFDRDVLVVETAYPWTLAWSDNKHNPVGEGVTLIPEFAPTPDGQRDFLIELRRRLEAIARCRGFVVWEPAWLASTGAGSPWENLALFDFEGRALPAWGVFGTTGPQD